MHSSLSVAVIHQSTLSMWTRSLACVCVRVCVCVRACVHVYVCAYACMCVCERVSVCISAYVCLHACTCVRAAFVDREKSFASVKTNAIISSLQHRQLGELPYISHEQRTKIEVRRETERERDRARERGGERDR